MSTAAAAGQPRRANSADRTALEALQHAAYAPNRAIIGAEPLPLLADYREVMAAREVWLWDEGAGIAAALILEPRDGDLLIWNVSVAPGRQGRGLGNRLLAFAEERAAALGKPVLRLYTAEKMARNVAWYQRHGYLVERREAMTDRIAVHMMKSLH